MTLRAVRAFLVTLVAVPLAITAAAPARAADTVRCEGAAFFYAADTAGKLYRYGLSGPDREVPTWSPREPIGSGWAGFGRVLAGPGGRIYGINAQGVQRYKHIDGPSWERSRKITDSWTAYGTAQYRNKITIDEIGDFYLIDAAGRLRWSRYDEQTSTWTSFNQVLATGWDRFDLIVAGTRGTLYAREPSGKLFRFRYDADSQRWLEQERPVGTGWSRFTKGMMSAGGDVLFGIAANGDMHHYRFREDNGSWPLGGKVAMGTGWAGFPNVTTMTNTCRLTEDHTPPRPNLPATSYSAAAAAQSPAEGDRPGVLHFAITHNGSLHSAVASPYQPTPDQVYSDPTATDFTGKPSLVTDGYHDVLTATQRRNSQLDLRSADSSHTDLGGSMAATPVLVRLSDGSLAAFGVGVDGSFWHRRQDLSTSLLWPWVRLDGASSGDARLIGELTATPIADGGVVLLARDLHGKIQTARYRNGTLETPWVSMGPGQYTGAPSVVKLPGSALAVFVRTIDGGGDVAYQHITSAGEFAGEWKLIGNGTLKGSGPPAAVLPDDRSTMIVFSRSGKTIYFAEETSVASGVWGDAQPATMTAEALSDPTALLYQDGPNPGARKSAFVVRNGFGGVSVWTMSSAARSGAKNAPFTERVISGKR